jgi:hypothetical protein
MGRMIEPKKCSVCNVGYLIPTGNNLNEFKCDNPKCRMNSQNKAVDMNTADTVKVGEHVDMEHYREEIGD